MSEIAPVSNAPTNPAPGWYPHNGQQRWWSGAEWTEHYAPVAQQFAPVYVQQAVSPALAPLSVGLAYVLLIFLGGFGIHKFYVGKVGMGVLYIFTGGLFFIGLIVDLFTMASQVNAANARRAVGIV